jgi:hypothetical protein
LTAFSFSVFKICSFFHQLYSLNDYKPPISKAKMTQITKAAIKAIKVSNFTSVKKKTPLNFGG